MNGLLRNIKDPNAKFAWIAKKWSFKWWEPKVLQDVFRWQNPFFSNNFAPKFKMTKKQEICFGCDFNKNLEIYWHKWLFDTFVICNNFVTLPQNFASSLVFSSKLNFYQILDCQGPWFLWIFLLYLFLFIIEKWNYWVMCIDWVAKSLSFYFETAEIS